MRSCFVLASLTCSAFASIAMADGVMSVNASVLNSSAGTSASREFTVNVDLAAFVGAVGAQATVAYDPAAVEYLGILGGDDFPAVIYSSHNTAASKVTFATGLDPSNPGSPIAGGNIAKLSFRSIAAACSDTDSVVLSTSSLPSRVTDSSGSSLAFTDSNNVSITSLAPFTLSGVPSNVSVAADAGTTAGSLQSLTAPTASDSCGTALSVSFSRSDSASSSAYYPVGTTTITYSATDAAGNSDSANVTVTVANYQLLDASFGLVGSIAGSSSRSVRLSYGASSQVVTVSMLNGSGTKNNVQLPVAASYGCMTAKDTGHSLSDAGAVSVSGVKYSAAFANIKQGDSNDDNFVDILDFGIYVGDFGSAAAGDISNFNDDANVNNGDFGFISVNFATSGESCSGSYTGGTPRTSVSIRELRRQGLGYLASSDLNRDGTLDVNDIVWYLQNGIPSGKSNRPSTPW